ncbi:MULTISPECIES: hypothetical protein [Enterobacteriaceae]|uniref:hypothetical protein n=1 Tax=Enterobacteriaceae TaxID=543 RepID=UPI0015DC70D8|nr:hypothetical protein [Klebsiella sp. WP4-W18-ESBL-05]BBR58323.1 hypothetical protein WP4W18E05_16910 [Klebsiella sp. WP4-W18-ESBL-05]
MKIYAFIQSGEVVEIIQPIEGPDGKEIDISERFAADFVSMMVNINDVIPQPGLHWKCSGGEFTPPELNEIIPARTVASAE